MKRVMVFAAAALLGHQAAAREVTIEEFQQTRWLGRDNGNEGFDVSSGSSQPGSGESLPGPFDVSGTATENSHGVTHLDGSALADQLLRGARRAPRRVQSGSSLHGYAVACPGPTYTPTWWLPRETEARRAHYYPVMASIACQHGIAVNLLDAVIAQESGYKSWAISSSGAMGIMQVMPGTARLLGLSQPFDPIANMRAGARYLRRQIDRFGRIDLALAAYNAGPERKSLQAGKIPAIRETRNYVRAITINWARLASRPPLPMDRAMRSAAAIEAVRGSGYRDVHLIRYQAPDVASSM